MKQLDSSYKDIKNHVLNQINNTNIGTFPFHHLYIENIFTDNFYDLLYAKMLYYKYNKKLENREWDSSKFINKKYHLTNTNDEEINIIRQLFDDNEIKLALLKKFYIDPKNCDNIIFNIDLQFVFASKNMHQDIHTDISSQYLSFIFYLPEKELSINDELDNGTILYDKSLKPYKLTKFKKNSLCCFAPHFYSYHGFSTTIDDRNVLLFFYSQNESIKEFYKNVNSENKHYYYNVANFKNRMTEKLEKYKLIEYTDESKIIKEKEDCLINAPNGRIVYDKLEA
jgi:hypothetical protein